MTEKIYSYDEAKTALAKVPDDHVCYGKSPAGVRFYVYAYKSDNHYKPYLKLEVNQVTWMMLRINDVKLPKIPIDYSKAGYPLDGSTVLIHCEEMPVDTFYDMSVGVVEAYFELDGENSRWVVNANPENLGVTPKYYTPMPEFEEVKS